MQKSRCSLVDQISSGDRVGSPLAGDCLLEIARRFDKLKALSGSKGKRASYNLNGYSSGEAEVKEPRVARDEDPAGPAGQPAEREQEDRVGDRRA